MAQAIPTQDNPMPPSPPIGWFGGHFFRFRRNPTKFLQDAAKLGDVVLMSMGGKPMYFLNHPDFVREVFSVNNAKFEKGRALKRSKRLLGEGLLTSESDFHLRQRRMIQPAFHRQRIAGYAASMVEYGERMADKWQNGATYDVSREMMHLTLQIVGKTLFSANVEDEADEVGAALTAIVEMFDYLLLPFSEILEKLPLIPLVKKFDRAKATMDGVIYRIIEERRKTGEDKGDLLTMLLEARDIEGDGTGMSDKQLRDEALTLFLAGHETTANALTWTWYLLSQNAEAEAKLHEEIDRVLAENRPPTFEDYASLKYTEAVIAESMRLYPPAWAIGRMAMEDYEIGGYQIPQKSLLLFSPFVAHRDVRFWAEPDKFLPERWLAAENSIKEAGQKYIYFPFGGGVRRCIGEQFAWTEGVLLLATLARKWKLRLVPSQKVELNPLVTLRPKYGMKMITSQR